MTDTIDRAIGKLEAAKDLLTRSRAPWAIQLLAEAEDLARVARYELEHQHNNAEPGHGG